MRISPALLVGFVLLLAAVGCGGADTGGVADTILGADVAADTSAAIDTAIASDTTVAADTASPPDVVADTAAADTTAADTGAMDTSLIADTTADTAVTDTATADTTTACTANPFTPHGSTVDWDHGIQTPITLAFGDPNHRGQDVIVAAGRPQLLIGKFAYGFIDKDLKEENVEIWIQRDPPCGTWELLDIIRTSTDGQYGTQYGIEDDGGRVFYTVPNDQALPVGRYPVRMVVRGDHSIASFDLIVVTPGTQAVVFDIDGTLTTNDSELINEITQSIFNNTYDEALRADSVEVTTAWHDEGYLVVYLTGRPDLLRPMTEAWLEAHGFPPGPLHLTDTNGQVLPTNSGVGDYKTGFLAYLLSTGGLSVYAAYGNATTDIYAFGNASIPKEMTFIAGPHGGEEGTVNVGDDYQAHLPTAQAMPAATAPAPADNGWW